MNLIPVTVRVIKNESSINQKMTRDEVDLTFEIEVRGNGDFSEFIIDDQIDSGKIALALLQGKLIISTYAQ